MQQPIDKELLKKYLRNTCSPSELQRVRAYLLRPESQEILDELMTAESEAEWDLATSAPVLHDDELSRWQSKFEQRKSALLDATKTNTPSGINIVSEIKTIPGFFKRNNFFKYAAVLSTLILGIGIYSFNHFRKSPETSVATANLVMKTFSTGNGQRAKVALADGTIVFMGPASTLKYPEQFKDSVRGISLIGEAFFEVAANPHKPFIIQTHHIRTQVLGTSFKVNAIEGRPFEVQVATGKVRVDRISQGRMEQLAVLSPGQQVRLKTLNDPALSGQIAVADIQGWKNSRLVFKDQTIGEIAEQLERAYDVRFSFKNPQKAREVVTVTLQDNIPLNKTLQVLSAGAQFKFKIEGKNITIK